MNVKKEEMLLCKNCYKEIFKSNYEYNNKGKYLHKKTNLIFCYIGESISNSIAEPLEKTILCKHCSRPIIKCYRCIESHCIGNGYLHVYVYTKDSKKLDIDYNPHNCYYDEFNRETMAEPE